MEHFVFGHSENHQAPKANKPAPATAKAKASAPEHKSASAASTKKLPNNVVNFKNKRPMPAASVAKKPALDMGLAPKDNKIKKIENY